jgi:DUF438 domain-containing protein
VKPGRIHRLKTVKSVMTETDQTTDTTQKQAMYNITLRCVHAFIVAVENQSITYSECVFVALGIQYAICMHHFVKCGQPGSRVFFHIIS